MRSLPVRGFTGSTGGKSSTRLKEDLKARLGRSPDKADAVVMAVAGEVARKRRPTGGIATA